MDSFMLLPLSDLDWKFTDIIYIISWEENDRDNDCDMQYVGQRCRFL